MKKTLAILAAGLISFCILISSNTFAQSNTTTETSIAAPGDTSNISTDGVNVPEMATGLRSSGMIWIVVGVILIILFGLLFYLNTIDKKLKKLENEIHNNKP